MPRGPAYNNPPYDGHTTPAPEHFGFQFTSPAGTPSPHFRGPMPRPEYAYPPRSATRASHHRSGSAAYEPVFRPPTASPRYRSDGHYATADINVSNGRQFRVYYYVPVRRRTDERYPYAQPGAPPYYTPPAWGYREAAYETTYEPTPPRRPSTRQGHHSRRQSTSYSTPQKESRQSTSAAGAKPKKPRPVANEEDRKRWKIPKGYSLKNWDPTEQPILLLGSVFDASSLGKWIYDWTANVHGTPTPLAEEAGDLWLLLIQLYGKVSRMEKTVGRVRTREDKEMVEEFLAAGDRLIGKFQEILKSCEQPMLEAANKEGSSSLGSSAGVEFVQTLFGRDRKLKDLEKFMQHVRTFNLRFDVNCDAVVRNPTK
jgi:hypothetical protein